MSHESDLVTGDAVVLDLRLARSASRALAYGIDLIVQLVSLIVVVTVLALTPTPDDTAFVVTVITVVQVLVLIGYPATCETLTRGRTLGKAALGLRAVREDGGPIRFRHALVRALAGAFVDFGPFGAWSFIGFVVSLSSAKGKRVGDFLAGTVVVRERVPETPTAGLVMPPALAPWAAGLDLSGLPADLALAARQYLGRYHELDETSRERVGLRLAAEVAQRIGAPIPPYTPAWAYLSAVLAERQSREYARATPAPPGHPAPPPPPPPATPPPPPSTGEGRQDLGPFTPPS
ncbi:RDD family protein [Prauserella muralis]|uniref:Transporter n=1 Tax=Prauserella muralis TaxID=588067 RepID=A0A2V4BB58_9PSEU|nr:RDD family protein [Prauserella muralis]PXY32490.1 transporter [Prauserella muralis]TWE23809.1 putative RDD family membrane protein YckC [Prauserella muralis]